MLPFLLTILFFMSITEKSEQAPTTATNEQTASSLSPRRGNEGEVSYYQQRMNLLGITPEQNTISLWQYNSDSGKDELTPMPVFKEHPKGIEIIPYNLERYHIRIEKQGSKIKKDWSIVRLEKPIIKDNGDVIKYLMPKGQGSLPL